MKKLLGTTALVAAAFATAPAMAADKIKMKVGGYFVGSVAAVFDADILPAGTVGQDERTIRFGREAEIHFKGSTTLDNGIEIGVKAELELTEDVTSGNQNDDVIDESYIWVEGAFGEFQFGDQDGIGDQMAFAAPSPFLETFVNDTDLDPLGRQNGTTSGTRGGGVAAVVNATLDDSSDSTKIIYFTPRLAGFQVGLSYAPEAEEITGDKGFTDSISGDDDGENIFEAGLTFEHSFNSVDIALGATYLTWDNNSTYTNGNTLAVQNTDDYDAFSFGGSVGFAGFTVGGQWAQRDAVRADRDEITDWNLGATYGTGPWTFGLEYGERNSDDALVGAATSEIDNNGWAAGVAYSLGGGANVTLGYLTRENDVANTEGSALFTEFGVKF